MATLATLYYAVLIQTDPLKGYVPIVGWDSITTDRQEADSRQKRAAKLWHGAKVIAMTEEEAKANGWI